MFKPARMTRVLIGGHKSRMEDTIELLHAEKAMHLEDFQDPTGTTTIGTPLDEGDEASDLLVRVRGLQKALDAEGMPAKDIPVSNAAGDVDEIEAELGPVVKEAAECRAEISGMEAEISLLSPFSGIDADLGVLTSLRSVVGMMGQVKSDPRPALDAADVRYEAGQRGNAIIIAIAKDHIGQAETILGNHGFTATAIPEGATGTPAQRINELKQGIGRTQERLDRAEQRLMQQREQIGGRLAALERSLHIRVEKTQAPLRFGTTATTFHIEGWIPAERANRIQNALSAKFGDSVYFEDFGDAPMGHDDHDGHGGHDDHHVDAKDEAPIKLENKGLAKPYEFMLGLLGKPRYHEIDPTKLMLIFFPLFFGLMVGDALVGLAILGLGVYLKKNHIFGIGGPAVGRALVMGGFMAIIVGIFVFGEALGIHFVVSDEGLEHGELSWEAIIYGKEEVLAHTNGFPTEGFFHKEAHAAHHADGGYDAKYNDTADGGHGNETHNGTMTDATQAMPPAFAPMAESTEGHGGGNILSPHGTVHLKAGPVQLGWYSKIHDIQALLAWSILIAVVHLNLAFLIGIRNIAVGHGVTLAIQEKLSWILAQIGLGVAVWGGAFHGPDWALYGGIGLFVVAIGLLWKGVEKALGAPGFVAIIEFLGFFGNILSYTRLAAIGASKAGMALAFAALGFDVLGGGDLHSIVGWIVYLIGMVVITLLATLSGGLQSLRLQFVEFFGKFYEGGGRAFQPFGRNP